MTETEENVSKPPLASTQKGGAFHTFLKRGLSTLILISILVGVYLSKNLWIYVVVFSMFCCIASCEWASMLKQARIKSPRWLIIGAGTLYPLILGVILILNRDLSSPVSPLKIICYAPALVAIMAFLWELRRPVDGKETFMNIGGTIVSFIYPVWMFSFALMLILPYPEAGDRGDIFFSLEKATHQGMMLFIWLFLVTKITDIGAYLTGSLIGRHKMIPHISPGKTWEGFIGAIIITMLSGYFLLYPMYGKENLYLVGSREVWCLVFILVIALFSVVGDLAGSLIKRALGVKDSGKLLPGIGGVFDLIDSPAFTFPIAMLFISNGGRIFFLNF